ncbi:MAG: hypothetical protein ACU0CO_05855 [Shimia sp.]
MAHPKTELTLTETRIENGVWEGVAEGAGDAAPAFAATFRGEALPAPDVAATDAPGRWRVTLPIPPAAVATGVHTIVLADPDTAQTRARIAIQAGAPLADDLRVEVEALRDELALLKRAFRRHCVETGADGTG